MTLHSEGQVDRNTGKVHAEDQIDRGGGGIRFNLQTEGPVDGKQGDPT